MSFCRNEPKNLIFASLFRQVDQDNYAAAPISGLRPIRQYQCSDLTAVGAPVEIRRHDKRFVYIVRVDGRMKPGELPLAGAVPLHDPEFGFKLKWFYGKTQPFTGHPDDLFPVR